MPFQMAEKAVLSEGVEKLLRLGMAQKHAGKPEAAATTLRSATRIAPDREWLWAILGSVLHESLGKLEEAEHCYRKALALDPDYMWVTHRLDALRHGETPEGPPALASLPSLDVAGPGQGRGASRFSTEAFHSDMPRRDNDPLDSIFGDDFDDDDDQGFPGYGSGSLDDIFSDDLNRSDQDEDENGGSDGDYAPESLARHKLESGDMQGAEDILRAAVENAPDDAFNWANLARLYFMSLGRMAEAEQAFESALQVEREDATIWHSYAELLFRGMGRLQEAEQAYRQALDLDMENPACWIDFGELLTEQRRIPEARRAFGHAVQIEPKATLGWLHLGQLFWTEFGRIRAARHAFERAVALNPEDRLAWHALGAYLEGINALPEARNCYQTLLERFPEDGEGWALLGQLLLDRFDEPGTAFSAFDRAVRLGADRSWCQTQKAIILAGSFSGDAASVGFETAETSLSPQERSAEAERLLREALEEKPDTGFALMALARLLAEKLATAAPEDREDLKTEIIGLYQAALPVTDPPAAPAMDLARFLFFYADDPEAAETLLTGLAEAYREDWPYELLVSLFLDEAGDLARAENALRNLYARQPKDGWVLERLTDILIDAGREDEAEKMLRDRLDLNQDDDTAHYQIGHMREKRGDWEGAAESFRRVTRITPDELLGWYRLAEVLVRLPGQEEEALAAFDRAFAIDPEVPWLWFRYGRMLVRRMHRVEEAERALRRALLLDPGYAQALVELGTLLRDRTGQIREARQLLTRATRSDPEFVRGWLELGLLLEMSLGEYELAEAAYRNVLTLKPDHRRAPTQIARAIGQQADRLEEAVSMLGDQLEQNPADSFAWSTLMWLLLEVAQDPDAARKVGEEALQHHPDSGTVLVQYATVLARFSDHEQQTLDLLARVPEGHPDWHQSLFVRAGILQNRYGEHEQALELFGPVLDEQARNPVRLYQWANILRNTGDVRFRDEALRAIETSLSLVPDQKWHLYELGKIRSGLFGHHFEAVRAWKSALEQDRTFVQPVLALASLLDEEFGEREEAVRLLRSVYAENTSDDVLRQKLAMLLVETPESYDEGVTLFEQARRPAITLHLFERARASCLRRQAEAADTPERRLALATEALLHAEKAVSAREGQARSLAEKARCQRLTGQGEVALATAREALNLSSSSRTQAPELAALLFRLLVENGHAPLEAFAEASQSLQHIHEDLPIGEKPPVVQDRLNLAAVCLDFEDAGLLRQALDLANPSDHTNGHPARALHCRLLLALDALREARGLLPELKQAAESGYLPVRLYHDILATWRERTKSLNEEDDSQGLDLPEPDPGFFRLDPL